MNDTVPNEKFTTANLPDICAPRHALLNTFHRHAGKRIVVVSAPAGFGKTVSTLLWLSASGRKSIWIGLDEYDNLTAIFYKLLCAGIVSACPNNQAMAEILRSPSFASSPVEHTISLLSEFEPGDASYALVLDDMHLITNEEIQKSLPYVLRRLPMSFVTLILTRDENAECLEPYLSEGRSARITAEELSFSTDEIQGYFKAYGRFITPEEASAVKTVTDGWAIGVNVIVKSGQLEFGQKSVQSLDGYIKKHIWDKWDIELREFMLNTCLVDEITEDLANRLTGVQNSGAILNRLCATNSFVRSMGEDTYRYHHIFLDFLRNLFDADTVRDKNRLNRIISAYYMETGQHYASVRYAVKCEDYDALSAVMLELYQYSTSGSAVATHVAMQGQYLLGDSMPESFADNAPYVLISHTWYYFLLGDVERFCVFLDRLYAKLPEIFEHYRPFFEHGLLMTALDFRRPIHGMAGLLTPQMLVEIAQRNAKTTTLTENLPFIHRSHRDYSDFAVDIEGNMLTADQVFPAILAENYPCMSKALRAMLYYEKNMLNEAKAYSAQAISQLLPSTVAELRFSVGATQTAVLFALGQMKPAEAMLAEIGKNITAQDAEYLLPNFKAYETKLRLSDGDKKAAVAWLESYFVTHPERLELYKIYQHFTTARACIVLAKTEEAMRYIVRLKKLGEAFHRPLDIAEASVLQAIVEWASGKRKEAQDTLKSTLATIQGYGFVRIVADEGAAVLPILRKISLRVERDGYSGALHPHYIHEVILAAYEQSKRQKGLAVYLNQNPVRLSKQQKHILLLLSKGYKYKEIMELTGLTIHTVKSHASAAYAKLDVNNSMDATLKARELGLID